MKVTRMKRGYIIRLSDAEFELLSSIEMEGRAAYQEMHDENLTGLDAPEKLILTEVMEMKRDWMAVTDDRRN
jgi:hypothetical protein